MYEIDEKCRKCKNNGTTICNRCDMYYDEFDPIDKPPKTNADRVRNMDDYDLAIFLENVSCKYADTESWLDWLKEEG